MDPKEPEQITPEPTEQSAVDTPAETHSSLGPTAGIIIVITLLILGALYFWHDGSSNEEDTGPTAEEIEENDQIIGELNSQSNSDDLDSIESDLYANDVENIDEDAATIEAELQVQ